MWKESYRLGVENIDAQHKKLFKKTGELVREIEGEQRLEIYKEIIIFLENYVKLHFEDEEAYFESLGYIDEVEHKKQHRDFTQQVQKYSNELKQSDYAPDVVKKDGRYAECMVGLSCC